MDTAMKKLQTLLSEKLDREVSIEVYPDYNGVVEAMNYDQIDMAYLGPLTYVIAEASSNAKAIITQLIDGKPYYHSYIITHKDSPLTSMEDLVASAGKTNFAFGDPNSTSGALIPMIELQEQGIYKSEDDNKFASVRFTGSHDATALAVQNKQVDAAAIDSAIYDQLVESGKIDGEQFKTIWKSEELFQYPWAVLESTDDATIKTLQETFLAIEDPEILGAFGASGFTEASNEDYESIKQAAIQQGIIKE
jgi:phosphonate transport system substrate-binding protein